MATTINKQRVLNQFFTAIKKRYDPREPEPMPVLEQFLYAVCREGATREQADRAFRALRERFFDWNEVRVSSSREVEDALAGLPDAGAKAERLVSILQEVFEATFSFDLELLHKKGLKQAAKSLGRYKAANDYAVAWVTQQALGGHAVPLDAPALRVLRRLGVLENGEDLEALRSSVEHLVPKAKGSLFNELVSAVADEFCHEGEPNCSACPLAADCPSGQDVLTQEINAARVTRQKPR